MVEVVHRVVASDACVQVGDVLLQFHCSEDIRANGTLLALSESEGCFDTDVDFTDLTAEHNVRFQFQDGVAIHVLRFLEVVGVALLRKAHEDVVHVEIQTDRVVLHAVAPTQVGKDGMFGEIIVIAE